MKWDNFTVGRIAGYQCAPGKKQSIFWDGKTPGLGLRVTAAGTKSYVFETSLRGKTIRITIGDASTWAIAKAQAKATAYKATTDNGFDPRQLAADRIALEQAAREKAEAAKAADEAKRLREAMTLGQIWPLYISERQANWSVLHKRDHIRAMQVGGAERKRSKLLTKAGPLASLADVRLIDITGERVEAWALEEAANRRTSARLALRLLRACLTWCSTHKEFASIGNTNAAKSQKARESLGRSNRKNDVIQREQLKAWFSAVLQISNPTISAYLQCLLLTGARREELAQLKWTDVDFRWNSLKLHDKVQPFREVPLTPYVALLLRDLQRRNEAPPTVRRLRTLEKRGQDWAPSVWVFRSDTSASGRITDPSEAHRTACGIAGLPHLTLHGLRRSFATLSEWTETPSGVAAQIQGHAPQGVREQHYIHRALDLLRMWHVKIEAWMLKEADIKFVPAALGLKIATAA